MTDCRAKATLRALAVLGIVLSGPAFAAELAQTAPPVRLQAPRSVTPEEPKPAPVAEPAPGRVAEKPFDVAPAPPIDIDSLGALDEARGGFPASVWQGSQRRSLQSLVTALPNAMSSPTLRSLKRKLLMTAASVPEAASGAADTKSFMTLRANVLFASGELAGSMELINAVPSRGEHPDLARIQIEGLLLAYDNAGACALARTAIARFQDAYWQKALIFCQALAGDHGKAGLGLGLLREMQTEDDPAFVRLVAALGGDAKSVVESLPRPQPLHLAMLRAARQNLPRDALNSADLAALRIVATSPNASLDLRLAAAERAEAAGVVTAEALGLIYDSVPFTPEQLGGAATVANLDAGPRGRALLYRAARAQAAPPARTALLQRSLGLGKKWEEYLTAVRVTLPMLLEIAPSDETATLAPALTRAMLAAGRPAEARAWFALVQDAAKTKEDAAKAEAALWPLVRLAAGDQAGPWEARRLKDWLAAAVKPEDKAAMDRAALLFTLLVAAGETVDAADWAPLMVDFKFQDAAMPAPSLWLGLRAASRAGRVGETILESLVMLGDRFPQASSPYVLAEALSALRAVGLGVEARALALEAALAAGL